MIVKLNSQRLQSLDEIRAFLAGAIPLDFEVHSQTEAYRWIEASLHQLGYHRLGKADKGQVKAYLEKITGFSRSQVTRLIQQHRSTSKIRDHRGHPVNAFARYYRSEDIVLLAEVDTLHGTLSGPATRKICERAFEIFGDRRFERLAHISNGHLYNLRHSSGYQRERRHVDKTRPTHVNIGERRKPAPDGRPGFLRVDTVHQGDLDGIKGLYHINAVDEVTQFQVVVSVEKISEHYLIPALELLIDTFPFVILGFHTDNGSEYINYKIARLLEKLRIELTKSRARQSNDNALVESKNGSIVRKILGHGHIPGRFAQQVNAFTANVLSPYLNFHRPCLFSEVIEDVKGKRRKRYPYELLMTPYDKLKSLPNATQYLKPGTTFQQLDDIALQHSDNDAARQLNEARAELFENINKTRKPAA
jgi:transposase InsO family protein